ncbi:DUF2851 family protein [Daejeonella sp. H1SJ63]|uniref:DUF2851 family protein n=1 Tax=Daejeonella sp. H1SJ63 TaxID=3034145 RepID=UPI0023EC3A2F|nr:DUF2851 family protein [Daejeonella sp. H1SJ63]
MSYPEELLHCIWKFRLFDQEDLRCRNGEKLQIIRSGQHNHDAGPDFESAKIRIDDTLWAGNVEIHVRSSDWERHQHHHDPAYDNVILHVVAEYDQPVYRTDGTEIPVLEIFNRIPAHIFSNYQALMAGMSWIPCGNKFNANNPVLIKNWLSRLLIERMEDRSRQIGTLLDEFRGSWDDAFYISIARNFGFKINAVPFEMLARSLPRQLFGKYKNNIFQIEALVFGQAGFLTDKHRDDYPSKLRAEYAFLRRKHSLHSVDRYLWKFMRLRPGNFPTVRLAQFAALMSGTPHMFSQIVNEADLSKIEGLFRDLQLNKYWKDHCHFEESSRKKSAGLGNDSVSNLLINTVAVFLFVYGIKTGSSVHTDRGLGILENMKPENNRIIRRFIQSGFEPESALDTQALLQLKKYYCDEKKCLSCGIGIQLLNQ